MRAIRCLEAAWRDGFAYIKAGVLLDDLCPPEAAPPDLLDGPRQGSAALMAAVDRLNTRSGGAPCFQSPSGSSGRGYNGPRGRTALGSFQ